MLHVCIFSDDNKLYKNNHGMKHVQMCMAQIPGSYVSMCKWNVISDHKIVGSIVSLAM